jgi:hypothetical protein
MSLLQEYEKHPLVSFEQATQPLVHIVRGIKQMIEIVNQNTNQSADHLSSDESASIRLYTLEWKKPRTSFRFILNETLRVHVREKLLPWFRYLRLFIYALSKLPSISSHTVYRGLKMDETTVYSKDEKFVWWDFVSCTSSIEFAKNSLYENELSAIFIIECHSAKDITQYSLNNNENEIILYPERQFQVISSFDYGNQLKLIQLKEIRQDHPLNQISNTMPPIRRLEFIISQCQQKSTINLIGQGLTGTDMNIVVNQGIIDKQCQKLLLSNNKIKSVGSSIIAKSLNKNTTLKFLSLSYNSLSDEGVQSLTKILALNNSKLETLSLHKTGITDAGVLHLRNMLKKNKTLIWLHLGRNKISDQGIHLLANVLINHNDTLRVLDLSYNKLITDSSVNSLVEIFQRNKSLETLWINNCNISEEGKKKLKQNDQSNQRFFLLFVKDYVRPLPDTNNPDD